jgi:hypothetical protein
MGSAVGRGVAGWLIEAWRRLAARGALASLVGLMPAAQAAPGLTIGAIVPQSWPHPHQGEEIVLGMQLAIKTWPGQPVPTLVVKDSGCDPRKAEAAARELLAAKVDMVLGSWCTIGTAPKVVAEAGVPYVSAHAERLARPPNGVLQLGRIEMYAAEQIAQRLRGETGLRISARTSCWMDFEPVLFDQYDGVLCPVLGHEKARWEQAEATFTAALRKPFTLSAARGYAAMEAALAQLRRLKSGSGKSNGEGLATILGPVPPAGSPAPADALQLVFAQRLPKLGGREQAALSLVLQAKSCTCAAGASCPQGGAWAGDPFVVRGNSSNCPAVASATQR